MREGRRPKAFIGSSSEALGIAYALQENLEADAEITVWTQGIFEPSKYPWSRFWPRWMHVISAYLFSLPMISRRSGAPRPSSPGQRPLRTRIIRRPPWQTPKHFSHTKGCRSTHTLGSTWRYRYFFCHTWKRAEPKCDAGSRCQPN